MQARRRCLWILAGCLQCLNSIEKGVGIPYSKSNYILSTYYAGCQGRPHAVRRFPNGNCILDRSKPVIIGYLHKFFLGSHFCYWYQISLRILYDSMLSKWFVFQVLIEFNVLRFKFITYGLQVAYVKTYQSIWNPRTTLVLTGAYLPHLFDRMQS